MEIKNCKKCGRIYNYIAGENLCPRCKKELDEKFHDVKEYIYDHPGCGISEVSDAMDVTMAQIKQWVREERLEFAEGSVTDVTCESCGKPLRSGRFCPHCKETMMRELGSVYQPERKVENSEDTKKKAKMRYL